MQQQDQKPVVEVQEERILSRAMARELSLEEVEHIGGGTTSCSGGSGDDCDISHVAPM